jgi:hypothetical protein
MEHKIETLEILLRRQRQKKIIPNATTSNLVAPKEPAINLDLKELKEINQEEANYRNQED